MVSATRAGGQSMSTQLLLACAALILLIAVASAWELDSESVQDGGSGGGPWRGSLAWYERHWRAMTSDPPPDPSSIIWPPFGLTAKVVVASILGFIGAAFSNAGGVGGGALFVPMFNLLLGYDAKTSAALSKATIFGGAVASVCINVNLRHPSIRNKTLIDYDIALLLQPMLLLGISIGVSSNVVLPTWMLKLLLVALLFLTTYKTSRKGLSTWQQESKRAVMQISSEAPRGPIEEANESRAPLLSSYPEYVSVSDLGVHILEDPQPQPQLSSPRLEKKPSMLEWLHIGTPVEEPVYKMVKWKAVGELVVVWCLITIIQVTKETRAQQCGTLYWILTAAQLPVTIIATLYGARQLLSQHRARVAGAHPLGEYEAGELQWNQKNVAIYPLYSLVAGIMGGLLGIGGALVLGPVLLEVGVPPQVTAATSTFMVVFSSSMSAIEYYLIGRIPIEVALYFSSVCMLASFVGISIVRVLVVRTGKASITIFVLAFVMGASALLMLVLGGMKVYDEWMSGAYMGFSGLCHS